MHCSPRGLHFDDDGGGGDDDDDNDGNK